MPKPSQNCRSPAENKDWFKIRFAKAAGKLAAFFSVILSAAKDPFLVRHPERSEG